MLEYSLMAMRRRWLLVLVSALAAGAATWGVFQYVPPVQQSSAAVLFVPSLRQPGVEGPTNPLLELGGSVGVIASVVQIAVTDDETAQELEGRGLVAEYEVVPDLGENAGPVLLVTTEHKSREISTKTRDALVKMISDELRELQDARGVSSSLRVDTVTLTSSPQPEPVQKRRIQFATLAGGGTLTVLLLSIVLLDKRIVSRSGKQGSEDKKEGTANDLAESKHSIASGVRPKHAQRR